MSILNYVLIVIMIFFIIVIISSYKKLKYICSVIDEILSGNLNQRIRFQSQIEPLNKLSIKINKIIDKFQKANAENILNEETRKKMISNISHDLRTPLTSMLGYMELILEDKELNEDKKKEYLDIIYSKGNSLYSLMEEFFQLSKLESNDIKLNLKEINISELIRQNIISFYSQIEKYNIKVCINIPNEDVYIISDEKCINRILNNLINNSLKHGVKVTKMGVNLSTDDDNVFIDVYDNGIGIPKEELKFVFDRLYTVEKSRSTNLKSSGLGLTIVKKLTEILDGDISVESVSFEKTVFTIRLPRRVKKYVR